MTLNSTDETMGRNSGVFWAFFQCSFLIGSLIVYYCFKPKSDDDSKDPTISLEQRSIVLIIFTALAAFGTLFFFLLRSPRTNRGQGSTESLIVNINRSDRSDANPSPFESLISSFKLFITKPMLVLNIVFLYTGLELTFFSGVYGTSVGNTLHFQESRRLIGLSGVFIGVGEILGGGLFGIFGARITTKGRDSVVLLGMFIHFVTFYLILLNLPEESPNGDSHDMGYWFEPSVPIAMLCAFLLGFGDSCFNTQIMSLLGNFYSDNSASAFAIFKFTQSVAAAIGFFYSAILGLKAQLLILVITAFLGTMSFFIVERMAKAKARAGYRVRDAFGDRE